MFLERLRGVFIWVCFADQTGLFPEEASPLESTVLWVLLNHPVVSRAGQWHLGAALPLSGPSTMHLARPHHAIGRGWGTQGRVLRQGNNPNTYICFAAWAGRGGECRLLS